MATRCYFPLTRAADVSPTVSGTDWEHIEASPVRRALALDSSDDSTLTDVAITFDAADHLVNGDAHFRQYVSEPLPAQSLAGNIKAQLQCLEAHANNNLFLTLKVYVVSADGSSVTGTLLAITRDAVEVATSLTNRQFGSTALSSVSLAANDRLVVEVGLGGTPTATGGVQGHNGTVRFGGSASGGDLAENDTETGTTFRPWIEFSQTIVRYQPYQPHTQRAPVLAQ